METTDRLRLMVAAGQDPALTSAEVDELVAMVGAGASLEAAAAEGWRWKAAKVSDRTDVADEAAQLKRSQLHAQCLAMAKTYQGRADEAQQRADRAAAGSPVYFFPAAEAMPRESPSAAPW